MAIAHDASTRWPATENTTDANTGDQSFTHTPTGEPKGVVVVVCCTGTSAACTGVTYGGVAMTSTVAATDTSEAGRVEVFTFPDTTDVPAGARDVVVQGCTTSPKFVTCSTVTAATKRTKVNTSNSVNTTTAANPSVTLTTTATTQIYGGLHTGALAPATTPAAGCTLQNNRDYGALSANTLRRTSADASGTPALGVTLASDDYCIAAVALAEYTPPTGAGPHVPVVVC